MSDQEQEITDGDIFTHAVTHNQFTAFLNAKAPEKPCPECGINDWGTNPRSDDVHSEDPKLQVAYLPGWHTTKVMPAHSLHCNNCGFSKLFAATIVTKWVEDNASS